ncbi:dihydrofolate reductase family protein [Nocardioides pantholopis]|uniref:dihydrofolate reductase family protein n=1 Tax=Nocardioides pantholopis TaxID=2483798 RepID=UPI000F07460F|nr:dihydrofolate reductase family protein [Nocardioides pantholopis]
MREVVLYTLLSLDGVAEEPGNWMFEADDGVFENLAGVIATQDDVLLGRGTYDYWAGYWPTAQVQPFADFINGTTKHVFTSSRPDRPWSTSVVADAPLVPYVERLRHGAGRDIGVHGSIGLAQDLLAADLVDRLELVVVPTVAGSGRRLFTDTADLRRLHLVKTARSSTGCVLLGYGRR